MFKEITDKDNEEEVVRKSGYNMYQLEEDALNVWHDFQCVDLTNGDRRRFIDWIVGLFLEDK